MNYAIDDKINYFFKGDEDNEPCEDVMIVKALKDLDNGEVFKLKPTSNNNNVLIKGDYDKSTNKYWATKWHDIKCSTLKDGNTLVFTSFIF